MQCLFENDLVTPVKIAKKLGYKVNVKPSDKGSERLIKVFDFDKHYEHLILSFDVDFDQDFDFAKGGKLLGLAPEYILSGGMSRENGQALGWSVRSVFGKNGALGVYYYLPDDQQKYGNFFFLKNFKMSPGKSYKINLELKINNDKEAGYICISAQLSGKVLSKLCRKEITFSHELKPQTEISRLLFNFFHGGHSMKYKPSGPSNVTFSNIEVMEPN